MPSIPPTIHTDTEDVAWALQTAEALWKRQERADAIVWLRRAAQAAGDAEDDDRALALARNAAELADWVTRHPVAQSWRPPGPPAGGEPVDDLLARHDGVVGGEGLVDDDDEGEVLDDAEIEPADVEPEEIEKAQEGEIARGIASQSSDVEPEEIDEEQEEVTSPHAPSAPPPAVAAPRSAPAPAYPSVVATLPLPPPVLPPEPAEPPLVVAPLPPPVTPPLRTPPPASPLPPVPAPAPVAPPPKPASAPPPSTASSADAEPGAAVHVPTAAEAHAGMLDPWAEGEVEAARSALSAKGATKAAVDSAAHVPDPDEVVTSAPPVAKAPARKVPASRPPVSTAPLEPLPLPPPPAPPVAARPALIDLSTVEALSDLPDDARIAFARQAKLHDLRRNDEVANFALALIVEGSVEVAATIVDSPAQRLDAGAVLRGRGTISAVVSMRLVSAADHTRVATWDEREVADAFRSCPWVEDELRAAGNRVQSLVGVTMGPLGERLDPVLRANVTSRMRLRILTEHEVFANAGAPIPGLLVVGAGELELLGPGGSPEGPVLRAGDFLFPNEVLRAAPAPRSVRASKGGAIILVAERGVAQELLVTCPPLLEIFAEG